MPDPFRTPSSICINEPNLSGLGQAPEVLDRKFHIAVVAVEKKPADWSAVHVNHAHFLQDSHGGFNSVPCRESRGSRLNSACVSRGSRLNRGSTSFANEDSVFIRIHPRGIGGGNVKVEVGIQPNYLQGLRQCTMNTPHVVTL
jgi:hypothetical protein